VGLIITPHRKNKIMKLLTVTKGQPIGSMFDKNQAMKKVNLETELVLLCLHPGK
jgi:hypothetical protein